MTVKRWLVGGLLGSCVISALLHAGAWAGFYAAFRGVPAPIVAELDLSLVSMVPPNPGGGRATRSVEAWTAPPKGPAPAPSVPPEDVRPAAQPAEEESTLCPEPCKAAGEGTGGGGTGEGHGVYVPASQTARQPRWIRNFITSRDYPILARQQGKDGRVTLSVLLDSEGRVLDVRLLEGAYELLNEVALRKVRQAVFTPAYDASGKAVPCQVTLPIRFELR
ncbi:MAG: energy transducer TonB [Elusimicrobia bacterium]|nr:energy transducer TonB [Elusimicrobiota bacterium]